MSKAVVFGVIGETLGAYECALHEAGNSVIGFRDCTGIESLNQGEVTPEFDNKLGRYFASMSKSLETADTLHITDSAAKGTFGAHFILSLAKRTRDKVDVIFIPEEAIK